VEFLVGYFWGMFCIIHFGEMEQNRFRKDGPKSWEVVLWNSWLAIFGGCFAYFIMTCIFSKEYIYN